MGKFDGVLLVSDVCNTLLDIWESPLTGERPPEVPERNRQALEYFVSEGGRFTAATGRTWGVFRQFVGRIPVNAPVILGNGAALCDSGSGEYLETALLDQRAEELGQAVLDRFPGTVAEAYHLEGPDHTVRLSVQSRFLKTMRAQGTKGAGLEEISALTELTVPMRLLRFRGTQEVLGEIQELIHAHDREGSYRLALNREENALEMTSENADKGVMVRRLAKRLGISMERVYCVGDGLNDLSMLAAAKKGFAPCGCDKVLESCATVVQSYAKDGAVADVVSLLDLEFSEKV